MKEKNNCLHCEKGEAAYCEDCFQKLIAISATFQKENKDLKELLRANNINFEEE